MTTKYSTGRQRWEGRVVRRRELADAVRAISLHLTAGEIEVAARQAGVDLQAIAEGHTMPSEAEFEALDRLVESLFPRAILRGAETMSAQAGPASVADGLTTLRGIGPMDGEDEDVPRRPTWH